MSRGLSLYLSLPLSLSLHKGEEGRLSLGSSLTALLSLDLQNARHMMKKWPSVRYRHSEVSLHLNAAKTQEVHM